MTRGARKRAAQNGTAGMLESVPATLALPHVPVLTLGEVRGKRLRDIRPREYRSLPCTLESAAHNRVMVAGHLLSRYRDGERWALDELVGRFPDFAYYAEVAEALRDHYLRVAHEPRPAGRPHGLAHRTRVDRETLAAAIEGIGMQAGTRTHRILRELADAHFENRSLSSLRRAVEEARERRWFQPLLFTREDQKQWTPMRRAVSDSFQIRQLTIQAASPEALPAAIRVQVIRRRGVTELAVEARSSARGLDSSWSRPLRPLT